MTVVADASGFGLEHVQGLSMSDIKNSIKFLQVRISQDVSPNKFEFAILKAALLPGVLPALVAFLPHRQRLLPLPDGVRSSQADAEHVRRFLAKNSHFGT